MVDDLDRWRDYVNDSLIETSISRDVLLMTRVDKPALLRQLFYLGCEYSGQIVAYDKMLGQLTGAGNTTTLAHYLELLAGAGLIVGLRKFSGSAVRRRGSSPKLQVLNTALMAASTRGSFDQVRGDTAAWGRFVESAVGAYLLAAGPREGFSVEYWRKSSLEVDFVLERDGEVLGIEVESGSKARATSGMSAFAEAYPSARVALLGGEGLPIEELLRGRLRLFA